MENREKQHLEFIEETTGRLLWRYSSTMVMGFVAVATFGLVDSFFVGNFIGEMALAGIAASFPIMLLQMSFGMMINVGTSTLVSIKFGEKDFKEAKYLLGSGLLLSIVAGVFFILLAELFLKDFFLLVGIKEEVFGLAMQYSQVMILGSPFAFVSWLFGAIIRNDGNPKIALSTMMFCILTNIILNPVFIVVLKMGVAGSAWASVVADVLTLCLRLGYFFWGKKSTISLSYKLLIFNMKRSLAIIGNGSAAFLEQSLASILFFVVNLLLVRYGGELALACGGVIERVSTFIYLPVIGISLGVQPIIGYNFGAKNYHKTKEVLRYAMVIGFVVSLCFFIIAFVWAKEIICFFVDEATGISIGTEGLRLSVLALPIVSFAIIGAEFFPAIGKARIGAVLTVFRQVICHIPIVFVMAYLYGLTGIWFSWVLSDLLAVIATFLFLKRELNKLKVQEY